MLSYGICLFLFDLLHLIWETVVVSMLLQMAYFVLFYGWIILHYVYIPHFLNPSVNGHLACFHVLTIVNSAFMNTGVHVYFWIVVLSEYLPRRGWLDYMVVLYLVFGGTSILFPRVVVPIYISTNSVGVFPFLHTLSSMYYL